MQLFAALEDLRIEAEGPRGVDIAGAVIEEDDL